MDKQRSQAIESLEISNDSVKCQKCGIAVPIVGKLTKPKARNDRIVVLEKQIKWIEAHSHHGNNNRSSDDNGSIKQLKQELAELLTEEAKADKLRRLRLYSCRITGFRFVCSKCYDKVYNNMLLQKA
jgi:adenine-specific DNA methylase